MPHPKARNRLATLVATNQAKTFRAYRVEAATDAEDAVVYLYDLIDPYWGVSAAQFAKDLAAIKAKTIHLRINSPGGDVFEGRAIATAIRAHGARVVAHVDGLAASAASFIALAADEVEMGRGAMMMIHRAWGWALGNAEELRQTADVLEKIDESLVDEYVAETGNTADQVRAWLTAETWFTDAEAVEHGFADRIAGADDDAEEDDDEQAAASNAWDLSAYDHAPHAPRAAAADPAPPVQTITVDGKAIGTKEAGEWFVEQIRAAVRERDVVVVDPPEPSTTDESADAHAHAARAFALVENRIA